MRTNGQAFGVRPLPFDKAPGASGEWPALTVQLAADHAYTEMRAVALACSARLSGAHLDLLPLIPITAFADRRAASVVSHLQSVGDIPPDEVLASIPKDLRDVVLQGSTKATELRTDALAVLDALTANAARRVLRARVEAMPSDPIECAVYLRGTAAELETIVGVEAGPAAPRYSTYADLAGLLGSVSWAWEGWLPNGLLTMLAGESAMGKSHLAIRVASTFLRGDSWPDGQPFMGQTGKVLWAEAEGGAQLHHQRLIQMGLDPSGLMNPFPVDSTDPWNALREFSMTRPSDVAQLQACAMLEETKLIVLDSLSAASGGKNENSSEMLDVMRSLAGIARISGKPVLCLHHFNKMQEGADGGSNVDLRRVRGSSAIIQLPRVVWALDAPNAADADHRRLSCPKNNLTRRPEPLGFRIHDSGVQFTANVPRAVRLDTAVDRAREFLYARLEAGPVPSKSLEEAVQEAGISRDSYKKARKQLDLVATMTSDRIWITSLPSRRKEEPF